LKYLHPQIAQIFADALIVRETETAVYRVASVT